MTAPSFTYEVASEHPERVRDELCRLWRENLRVAVDVDRKFRWLYRDAPEAPEKVFVLRARGTDGVERVVGTNGIGVRVFQLGRGRMARAGVSGDLAVEVAHRGLLPALRLVKAVHAFVNEGFDVAYGFPNAKAQGVMVRAGFRVLGKAQRHVRVLRHAGYASRFAEREEVPAWVARLAKNPSAARIGGAVIDVARLALGGLDFARARSRYRLEWTRTFDARFDALWERARAEYDIVAARTSAFLSWRFPICEVAMLVDRADRTLRAYCIVERDAATGAAHLRDVFGHADALAPLFDLLLPALWARGVASVSVRFLGAPRVAALLAERGFQSRGEGRTVVVHVGRTAGEERSRGEDPSSWHLFDLDEDT